MQNVSHSWTSEWGVCSITPLREGGVEALPNPDGWLQNPLTRGSVLDVPLPVTAHDRPPLASTLSLLLILVFSSPAAHPHNIGVGSRSSNRGCPFHLVL